MTQGVDVGTYQGTPNWVAVRHAGIEFAYIKATEGVGFVAATLDSQFLNASAAGLITGLYHYARPTGNAPEAEADAFAARVRAYGATAENGHLPPCLDLEEGSGNLVDWAKRFVARLRSQIQSQPVMLYSGASFFSAHIGEAWMDSDVSLWIAHYGVAQGHPSYITPRVKIHQYSSTGSVAGISGNVDLNVTISDLASVLSTNGDGGIENMALDTQWTDSYGNVQTIESWMADLQRKVNDVWYPAVSSGSVASRIPGDTNLTTVFDMVKDSTSWTNQTLGLVAGLRASSGVDPAAIADALRPVIADVVGPVIQASVTAALGADNSAQAAAIVDQIAARLAAGDAVVK